MDTLYKDVIYEILNHNDSKTISSLLSINKYFYSFANDHPMIKQRKLLSKELKKTIIDTRKYYTSEILNLKIGDRVTDRVKNYIVVNISKRIGILEEVDLYGNQLGIYTPAKVYNMKRYKLPYEKNNSFWSTIHYDNESIIINKLNNGIIKHEYGPLIKHIDSHYLNYITKQQYIFWHNDIGTPELNILVTVCYKWKIYEYYVYYMDDNYIKLKLVDINESIDDILIVNKINNKCINKKFNIIFYGGWKV